MNIDALFPSTYLKAADFPSPRVLTIRGIAVEDIGQDEQKKPVLYFVEEHRGLVLNKTNASMTAHLYGRETDQWVGKTLELHKEPVSLQGRVVDAIRVRAPQARASAGPAVDSHQGPVTHKATHPISNNVDF